MEKKKFMIKDTVKHKDNEYRVEIINDEYAGHYTITVKVVEKASFLRSLFCRKVLHETSSNYYKGAHFSYRELAERAVEAYHDVTVLKDRKAEMELERLKEFGTWDGVVSDD